MCPKLPLIISTMITTDYAYISFRDKLDLSMVSFEEEKMYSLFSVLFYNLQRNLPKKEKKV